MPSPIESRSTRVARAAAPPRLARSLAVCVLLCFVAAASQAQEGPAQTPAEQSEGGEPAVGTECAPMSQGELTASGLRVYVDPVTGQLTSTPPRRSRGLRIVEAQSMPPSGDVERQIVEIPGVGIGVYVGDLFVHSMKAQPEPAQDTDCQGDLDANDEAAKAPGQENALPVALQ